MLDLCVPCIRCQNRDRKKKTHVHCVLVHLIPLRSCNIFMFYVILRHMTVNYFGRSFLELSWRSGFKLHGLLEDEIERNAWHLIHLIIFSSLCFSVSLSHSVHLTSINACSFSKFDLEIVWQLMCAPVINDLIVKLRVFLCIQFLMCYSFTFLFSNPNDFHRRGFSWEFVTQVAFMRGEYW